jgi:hypothetical protein
MGTLTGPSADTNQGIDNDMRLRLLVTRQVEIKHRTHNWNADTFHISKYISAVEIIALDKLIFSN